MKTKLSILMILTFLGYFGSVLSQEKYAILISGDRPDYIYPGIMLEEGGKMWKGSWNDTYLMWEMLVYKKGYDNDNVFVLWADGTDWSITKNHNIAVEYDPQQDHPDDFILYSNDQITDYSATLVNVNSVFANLAQQLTQDDFLFVWVYGRNDHGVPGSDDCKIELFQNDQVDDGDFYNLVNEVDAQHKVVWMDSWFAGGFLEEFNQNNKIFWVGSSYWSVYEMLANDTYKDNNGYTQPIMENEIINNVTYYHGEFDFHLYGSTIGKSPTGSTDYAGTSYITADINSDNIISVQESFNWAHEWDDGWYMTANSPLVNNNIIGSITSLEYPTLLHFTYNVDKSWRGLIGVSKSFHVTSGNTLTFEDNSVVHLLKDADITVDVGATLIIGDNVKFITRSGTRKIIINGNYQIGTNVSFLADENAEIHLEIDNQGLNNTISAATFERAVLQSNQSYLSLANCNFNISGGVDFSYGTITVSGCHFDHTNFNASNASSATRQVIVNNQCTFDDYPGYALHIENYPIYNITNNTFTGNTSGIGIFWSGSRGRSISKNTITGGGNGIVVYNSSANISSNLLLPIVRTTQK